MSTNLIDSVKRLLGSDIASKASSMFGEDEFKMQNAITATVPSVLAGILNKAGSGDANNILGMAKDTANSGILSGFSGFFTNNTLLNKGADLLKWLFGSRTSDVANAISSYSGIKPTSEASLMSLVTPAALSVIGQHAEENNMNTGGFLNFLNGQKDSILNAIPSGLNLSGALGLTSLRNIGTKLTNVASSVTSGVREMPGRIKQTGSGRWVLPVILILAAVGLLWYLLGKKNNVPENNQAVTVTNTTQPDTVSASLPTRESIKVTLPNGIVINAYKGGIEDQLVNFIQDPSRKVDKNIWFDFDNLNFETGSAKITSESMPQVENIVAILKAFPKVQIKIGGYTDKTGDESANLKLSQQRADAVVNELKQKGISDQQLVGAEGYGSQFAKEPSTATDEERKKDRRISVSVRQK